MAARRRGTGIMRLLGLSSVLFLAACATQAPVVTKMPEPRPVVVAPPPVDPAQVQALNALVAMQDRLYRVGAPLLVNNTELCKGNARNLLGFTAKNKYSYTSEFVEAAHQTLGLNDRLQIVNVLGGSGAAKAGLRRGDVLLAAEEKPLPQGQDAESKAAAVLAPLVVGKSSVKLSVARANGNLAVTVPLTHACAFGIQLGLADHVNAYADGHRVLVTRGMLEFARTEEELAYVLAKEMAHNALAHAQKQRMNATIGGIIDNLVRMHPDLSTMSGASGVKPMPKELDNAADALALYMAARAGYSVDGAAAFWQRLAAQYPPSVANGYNAIHAPIAARLPAIEKTVAEIKRKQAAGKPLVP
ncbi:MAG TPA: M48 family metallopeptidase [Paucimonas sp.]|nr:M48 family metallopeptidase [Paucimonas sp.]